MTRYILFFYNISFYFYFFPFLLPSSSKFPRQERHLESKRRSNTERKIHLKQSRDVDRSPSCRCGDRPNGPGILKVSLHWHTLHFLPQRSVHGRWGFFSFLGSSYFLERIFLFFWGNWLDWCIQGSGACVLHRVRQVATLRGTFGEDRFVIFVSLFFLRGLILIMLV